MKDLKDIQETKLKEEIKTHRFNRKKNLIQTIILTIAVIFLVYFTYKYDLF